MKNIEKFTEEIKKQLLNVKLMGRDNRRYLYNQPDDDSPFVTRIDHSKDETYVKIVEFKYGYEYKDGYTFHIMCEDHTWKKPELHEMKIEFDNDGYFIISGIYITFEYWGKIDINF